jgi:hypothetical protein
VGGGCEEKEGVSLIFPNFLFVKARCIPRPLGRFAYRGLTSKTEACFGIASFPAVYLGIHAEVFVLSLSVFVPTQLRKTKSLNITSVSRASGGFKLMMIGVENNDVC